MIFRHTAVFTDLVLRQPWYRVQTGRAVCELVMEGKDLEGQRSVANTELYLGSLALQLEDRQVFK